MKKLYRSKSDRKLTGVCGGIAEYLGIDSTVVRAVWAIVSVFIPVGIVAYVVCAVIIPEEPEDYVTVTEN